MTNTTSQGCTDKTLPSKKEPFSISYPLYFGNESRRWENRGVAFIDSTQKGMSYGRAYLITNEQFLEIQEQECTSDEWYGHIVELGKDENDIPYKTFTQKPECKKINLPDGAYENIICQRLKETFTKLTEEEIKQYLHQAKDYQ